MALDRVVDLANNAIGDVGSRRVITSTQAVTITVFTRMYNNLLASQLLLHQGYGIQAGMLLRSILEDFINLHYIVNNTKIPSDDLARRFILYQHMVPVRTLKVLHDMGEPVPPALQAQAKDAEAVFRADFRDGRDDDWSGRDLRFKAVEAEAEVAYLLLHQELSSLLHGGPSAWQKIVEDGTGSATFLVGPHDVYVQEPIPALCLFITVAVQTVARVFDIPGLAAKAQKVFQELPAIWKQGA